MVKCLYACGRFFLCALSYFAYCIDINIIWDVKNLYVSDIEIILCQLNHAALEQSYFFLLLDEIWLRMSYSLLRLFFLNYGIDIIKKNLKKIFCLQKTENTIKTK